MAAKVQQLRTTSATKIPDGLEAGQIAFNLANKWMFVGVGGDDILLRGTPLTTYSTTTTLLGVAAVAVPAKPTAKGYEIFDLENGGGVQIGAALPAAAAGNLGQLFVQTGAAGPRLLISNGTAWVPTARPPQVLSLTDKEAHDAAGVGFTAKANAALRTKDATFVPATSLQSGDQLLVSSGTGSPYADAPLGQYLWDGTSWQLAGAGVPDAAPRTGTGASGTGGTKGVVYLARASDVMETGATGSTTPDPLAVPSAAQFKALADLLGSMVTGVNLMGTYDASASKIAHAAPGASAGTRTGFADNGKISAGSNQQEGDFFIVSQAGTIAGDDATINKAVNANDHIVWTGSQWHIVASGVVSAAVTVHSAGDVSDTAVATVTAANTKGILVRDKSVADGLPAAYKLVDVLDLGTF